MNNNDNVPLIETMIGALNTHEIDNTQKPTDNALVATGLEVEIDHAWIPTTYQVWRSWTGRRSLWGQEIHGPIYSMTSTDDSVPWNGARSCACSVCQEHVLPISRKN